jgi:hypothetical protein
MADKRISQLIERTDIANNDVLPIVASGATTTNKVTISTIQDWMQDNLDVGVTSVGITLGTTGTDVNVSGSPITTSGNITINIPDASTSARGVVTTGTQTFAGYKIFNGTIGANVDIQLATQGTALNTFIKNINATGQTSIGSNGFGFNNANNIYFSGSSKGGGIIAFSNTGNQTYTLQDASGTLAFTSDLTGYVTLGTAQTITAQKTFSTSGNSDTAVINHGSGSGIALNITKAGNGEGLRVAKTSGSGNAVTITGGTLSAEAGQFSGDLQTSTRIAATSGSNAITITPNVGGTQNRIETTGTLPLSLVSAAAITLAAGGTTPQITLATTGAVTLTGALSGTSATFGGDLTLQGSVTRNIRFLDNTNTNLNAQIQYDQIASNSGQLLFGTNNAGTFATRLTIANTGAATFSSSVTATGGFGVPDGSRLQSNGGTQSYYAPNSGASEIGYQGTLNFRAFNGNSPLSAMFMASNGNVGIGTASPDGRFKVVGSSGAQIIVDLNGTNHNYFDADTTIFRSYGGGGFPERMRITSDGDLLFKGRSTTTNLEALFYNDNSQFAINASNTNVGKTINFNHRNDITAMTITSGGNVCVNRSTSLLSSVFSIDQFGSASTNIALNHFYSGDKYIDFGWYGSSIGSITNISGTAVSFNTSSDYRLKEDLQEINGLEKIQDIKVYNYKWKGHDFRMDGVLAHELAEVLPYAVTGEKDSVDEDGNDRMQGVDYSKIVPVLIKAIQEQQEIINEMRAEIDSLKNQIK